MIYATRHIYIENPEREDFARKRRGLHQAGKETEKWKRFQRKVENLIHFENHLSSLLFSGKSNLGQRGTVVVFDKIQIYVLQSIVVLIKSIW